MTCRMCVLYAVLWCICVCVRARGCVIMAKIVHENDFLALLGDNRHCQQLFSTKRGYYAAFGDISRSDCFHCIQTVL